MDPTICKDSRVLIVLAFEQGSLAVRLKEKIMFADRATIIIKSGKGGNGHVSFRRENMSQMAVRTAETAAAAAMLFLLSMMD